MYISLGQMYTRLKRFDEAQQVYQKAEELSTRPDDKEYVYFLRGASYERQKKYDEAEEALQGQLKGMLGGLNLPGMS